MYFTHPLELTRNIFFDHQILQRHLHAGAVLHRLEHHCNPATTIKQIGDESTKDDVAHSLKRVARQRVIQPGSNSPVLVHRYRFFHNIVKSITICATRTRLRAKRCIENVTFGSSILHTDDKYAQKAIHIQKRIIPTKATGSPSTIAATDFNLIDCKNDVQKDMPVKGLSNERNVITLFNVNHPSAGVPRLSGSLESRRLPMKI